MNANTSPVSATALIADDEPLLRERLASLLHKLWPELQVVAQARNGREAIERFDEHAPAIVFLDIHMPGLSGVEVARGIGSRARIVFVTAREQYAVQAFEQGAVDYLVKPFDEQRLAQTLARLRERQVPAPPEGAELAWDLTRIRGARHARAAQPTGRGSLHVSAASHSCVLATMNPDEGDDVHRALSRRVPRTSRRPALRRRSV